MEVTRLPTEQTRTHMSVRQSYRGSVGKVKCLGKLCKNSGNLSATQSLTESTYLIKFEFEFNSIFHQQCICLTETGRRAAPLVGSIGPT